jgi:hypothetical protein
MSFRKRDEKHKHTKKLHLKQNLWKFSLFIMIFILFFSTAKLCLSLKKEKVQGPNLIFNLQKDKQKSSFPASHFLVFYFKIFLFCFILEKLKTFIFNKKKLTL